MENTILQKSRNRIPLFLFVIYICTYVIISIFHEPWFDEAQSWQIGRDASFYDMIFTLPHDEGHPALWWLILSVPAKPGVPFEIGLKVIGLVISSASIWLILFQSPFPNYLKYSLPFTFFLFYQYGIIVRPYGLMLLVFLLLGLEFKNRNQHPYRFIFLLCLLCATSAYGLLMAGGIAIGLCIEIIKEKGLLRTIKEIFYDRRTQALCLLLLVAILIVMQIMPSKYTNNADAAQKAVNPLWLRLLCMFFTIFPDCVLTQSTWFFRDRTLLQYADIPLYSFIPCALVGIIIWLIILGFSSRKSLKYILLPYLFFAFFGACVYFSAHHIGVALNLLLFWLWINFEDSDRNYGWKRIKKIHCINAHDKNILVAGEQHFIGLCLIMSILWNVTSAIQDIRLPYSYGRDVATFLKKHKLDTATIFCGWSDNRGTSADRISATDSRYVNTGYVGTPTLIDAYFTQNIVENFNDGHEAFLHQRYNTDEENEINIEKWSKMNPPDVLLDKITNIDNLFGKQVTMNDYVPVYMMKINYIWKGMTTEYESPIYLRKDLLDKYSLKEISVESNGIPSVFQPTSEQIEDLKNGTLSLTDVYTFLK